jgi:hypothetical protein
MPSPELQELLDHLGPRPDLARYGPRPDPAHIQAKVHGMVQAHLAQRGRHLATDPSLDLDTVSDEDLIELGRLDIIAQYPDLAPGLATAVDMMLGKDGRAWTRSLALNQHELDHKLRQVHDHGRLREEQVDLDRDHDRLQLMGIDSTPPEGQSSQTAPDAGTTRPPKILDLPAAGAVDQAQGGIHSAEIIAAQVLGRRKDAWKPF